MVPRPRYDNRWRAIPSCALRTRRCALFLKGKAPAQTQALSRFRTSGILQFGGSGRPRRRPAWRRLDCLVPPRLDPRLPRGSTGLALRSRKDHSRVTFPLGRQSIHSVEAAANDPLDCKYRLSMRRRRGLWAWWIAPIKRERESAAPRALRTTWQTGG